MIRVLAVLGLLAIMLFPTVALADTAVESTLPFTLEWGEGINGSFSHNTWYSADRHWVAFVYEGDIWCSSTADYGTTWDSSKVIDAGNTTFRGFSAWFDEANNIAHFARVADGNLTGNITDVIYHSSYTPNSNGSIVAVEGEVAVEDGIYVDGDVGTITIACDENGYPFIAWTEDEFADSGGGNYTLSGEYWVEVADSDTNDGTWVELDSDAWAEFDASGAASYGHDYDALYGVGNWTAIAVNLCPVGASGDLMHLSWSIEDIGADLAGDAGIDATIWNGGTELWGNLTWIVPVDHSTGLYPYTIGEIAFDAYDLGSTIHFVYCDFLGNIHYNAKSSIQSWNDVNGHGNWTEIKTVTGNVFPAISGYDAPGVGEDLIVVYHDEDSLFYDTKPYAGSFTGTWTEIWDIDDHDATPAHVIFLHNMQYKYGSGSPVGFAWTWGTLAWDEEVQAGYINYWWIDQDGVDHSENPLGWYDGQETGAADAFGSAAPLVWIFALVVTALIILKAIDMLNSGSEVVHVVIFVVAGVIGIVIVATVIVALS